MVEVVLAIELADLAFLSCNSLLILSELLVELTLHHPWYVTLIAILLQVLIGQLLLHREYPLLQIVSLVLEVRQLLLQGLHLFDQSLIVFV